MNRVFEVSNEDISMLKNRIFELYNVQEKNIAYGVSYIFQLKGSNVIVNVYDKEKNGKRKVMLQGKCESFIEELSKLLIENSEQKSISDYNYNETRIGIDESGKGDYFGPLVVGGVLVDKDEIKYLEQLGVRDSKKISDKKIIELFSQFSKNILWDKVVVSPERYNQLYSKLQNINKLLAWGHSRVAENLLEKSSKKCTLIIVDKFAKYDSRIENALMEKSRKCKLIQVHKGERDVAVATASVVARAVFITEMKTLSEKFDFDFAFGVSDLVKNQRVGFLKKYGNSELDKVAKLHFKLK